MKEKSKRQKVKVMKSTKAMVLGSVCFLLFAVYLFPSTFANALAFAYQHELTGASAQEKVDIRGEITNIHRADRDVNHKLLGNILIEGVKEADTQVDKASVRVTHETQIFDERGTERKQVSFDDLKTGQKVSARFVGPVMESYPVQATASEITILIPSCSRKRGCSQYRLR